MLKKLFCICLLLFCGMGRAAAEEIRVALVSGQYAAEISCEDKFTVVDMAGNSVTLPEGKYFLNAKDNALQIDGKTFNGAIKICGSNAKVQPQINKRAYRGSLSAQLFDDKLLVVNTLDLEEYVASVLPALTMPVWPDETIKAQAVAARSYAWYLLGRGDVYDVAANDAELIYTGIQGEKAAVSAFVAETKGEVLMTFDGGRVQAVQTSSTGGRTESAAALWGREVSYLQSVPDYDSDSPDYTWERSVSPAFLQNLLEQNGYAIGKLNSIILSPLDAPGSDRTPTGRVKRLTFSGSEGTAQLKGEELLRMLSLKSSLFDLETGTPLPESIKVPIENYYGMEIGSKEIPVDLEGNNKPVWKNMRRSYHPLGGGKEEKIIFKGRGSGSGLGLSAWGARGMANASSDNDYKKILAHYYPGTKLIKI